MSEVGCCASKAAVYTDNGGWQSADSGLSNIDVYLNPSTGAYRVVAIDAQRTNHHPINSNVWADLQYVKSSSIFHQWRDQGGRTYGLNFASQADADTFERGMADAVRKLQQGSSQGGAGAMAGLNLAASHGASAPGRPAAHGSSSLGQGTRMGGGSGAMMMTMPKDMNAAFEAQREADIAQFREMNRQQKQGGPPKAPTPPGSSKPPKAPPAPTRTAAPAQQEYGASPLSGQQGSRKRSGTVDGSRKASVGTTAATPVSEEGGDFTESEIEAWKEQVLAAVRAEIEECRNELLAQL